MDESSKENEENLMLFHEKTDENRPEMNEQNVSETNLASKLHGSISEIDKVTDKTVPTIRSKNDGDNRINAPLPHPQFNVVWMTEKRKFNPLFPTLIMGAGGRPTYFKWPKM
jgi:hypothetical protein